MLPRSELCESSPAGAGADEGRAGAAAAADQPDGNVGQRAHKVPSTGSRTGVIAAAAEPRVLPVHVSHFCRA